ncbi:hypothetical protein SCAB_89902 [Streptomyces scabiei 87.22]|uniref:Uncharacterized protein n=1 Tax=Streptomyces scabiei (strain 87.22) TaxID=680198 RepID=C9Z821_STRSW|nr:hypothetical protein SCAB_89902 [Streptomyces scabiei 87.22]
MAPEGVEPPQCRFGVCRLHERAVLGPIHLAGLREQVLPLGLGQSHRFMAGHLEAAGEVHERCGSGDVGQRCTVVPGMRRPGDLGLSQPQIDHRRSATHAVISKAVRCGTLLATAAWHSGADSDAENGTEKPSWIAAARSAAARLPALAMSGYRAVESVDMPMDLILPQRSSRGRREPGTRTTL